MTDPYATPSPYVFRLAPGSDGHNHLSSGPLLFYVKACNGREIVPFTGVGAGEGIAEGDAVSCPKCRGMRRAL